MMLATTTDITNPDCLSFEQSSCSREETKADNQTQTSSSLDEGKMAQISEASLNIIKGMKRSNRLEISSQRIIQVSVELFKNIADAFLEAKVMIVNLSNLPLSDSGGVFTQIPPHFFSEKIQTLTITRSGIGDEGFKYLCTHLLQMKKCFSVNLKNNSITEKGVLSVIPLLQSLETTITFDLQHNSITDKERLKEELTTTQLKHKIYF